MKSLTQLAILFLAFGLHGLWDGNATASPGDRAHVELDPLPFARGGYGGQVGAGPEALSGWRLAIASVALDVPDFATQLGAGNDHFHLRVRPSVAAYALYCARTVAPRHVRVLSATVARHLGHALA